MDVHQWNPTGEHFFLTGTVPRVTSSSHVLAPLQVFELHHDRHADAEIHQLRQPGMSGLQINCYGSRHHLGSFSLDVLYIIPAVLY